MFLLLFFCFFFKFRNDNSSGLFGFNTRLGASFSPQLLPAGISGLAPVSQLAGPRRPGPWAGRQAGSPGVGGRGVGPGVPGGSGVSCWDAVPWLVPRTPWRHMTVA